MVLADPESCGGGDFAPCSLTHAGLVKGGRPDEEQPQVIQVGGWAAG